MKVAAIVAAALLLAAGAARAEENMICRGNITSIQGEGLVARTYRFEVERMTGTDLQEILAKSKKIASEKQGKMYRKNPGLQFRKFSDLDLQCEKGGEKFTVRRSIAVN